MLLRISLYASTSLLWADRLLFFYVHRTLTKPVELLTCLKSIKEHAFVTSEYPVILTLEDHLSPDLQAVVAKVNSCFTEEIRNPLQRITHRIAIE